MRRCVQFSLFDWECLLRAFFNGKRIVIQQFGQRTEIAHSQNIRANGSTGKRSFQFLWICIQMAKWSKCIVNSVVKWISFCGMREKKQQCSREPHLDTKYNKYRAKCGTNVVWNFTIVGNSIYSHRSIIRLPFFAFYAFFFEI